ncbi:energy transducer TonB family protein [Mesorhizobium atlanticum]
MADGSIGDLQLAESSGSDELDQFALKLVRQQAPFPPHPARDRKVKLGIQSAGRPVLKVIREPKVSVAKSGSRFSEKIICKQR